MSTVMPPSRASPLPQDLRVFSDGEPATNPLVGASLLAMWPAQAPRDSAQHHHPTRQFGAFGAVGIADQQRYARQLVEAKPRLDLALAQFAVE